ncbi:MAG: 6-phosphogluconolactonase [candidate division WS1 bacterium]|jgi:6-phosphogluconolactonase|nr:6-phosphogluconolactonase [candidate division WS1 bacterium]
MTRGQLQVFPTLEDASRALAAEVARAMRETDAERSRVLLALSGGGTPRRLHEILATEHDGLPWPRTHVFIGDERFVPEDSPESNYRMASEALLDAVPVPPENVHPWRTDLATPAAAAYAMEDELYAIFRGHLPRFDVMLLGLGADGHTASLFPGADVLEEQERRAMSSTAPSEPRQRLTLTLPVLNAARAVHFLVSGADKREALECALGEADARCPASLVRPTDGSLTWWLDEEVAP